MNRLQITVMTILLSLSFILMGTISLNGAKAYYVEPMVAEGSPSCVAPPSGMVSWWPGDGNANDIQGINHGTLVNGATFAPGKVGQAFSFDGVDDGVTIQAEDGSLNMGASDFAVDAWVKFTGTGGTRIIFEDGYAGNSIARLFITANNHGAVFFRDTAGNSVLAEGTAPINDGLWHFLAGVREGPTGHFYVDGVLQDSVSNPSLGVINNNCGLAFIGTTNTFSICGSVPYESFFSGLIDEVEVIKRALSSTEILSINNAGSAGKCRPTCTPPPSGLVSWWPGDGNTNDIQGSNNGALMNGATFAAGMVGQAFSLDGVDDFVQVPDSPAVSITGAISMDAWIKPNSVLGSAQTIIAKYNTACPVLGTEQRSYILRVEPDGRIRFCLYPGDGNYRCVDTASPVISAGVFTHVAATFDPLTQSTKIYVNGAEVPAPLVGGSVNVITISDSDTPVTIGRNFCATTLDHFGGLIDEVELFNRELTSSEIQAIVNAGSAGKCRNRPPEAHCQNVWVSASSSCSANASIDNGSFDPDGDSITLTQSPPGPYSLGATSVTLTVTDSNGASSTCSATVTVRDITPPQIRCPSNITTLTGPGQCSAVVSFTPAVSDNCSGVAFSCSPASGSVFPIGTTPVQCIATDGSGNTASCGFTVTVTNPSPVASISSPPSGAIYAVGTAVSFAGSFTDNAGDTHSAEWSFTSSTLSIIQAGAVNESTGAVSASHSFTAAGVYLVTLTVRDHCGNTGAANTVGPDGLTAMVVIYDPDGGFVTGGGWINSPAGAYVANPALTGKASFGFVSKYQHGANVPTGNTEFQFRVASFNFKSIAYEWLVIAGARAQYKGSGTINGSGNYGFMLTAIDGQINGGAGVDKFRIKIWDKSNNDALVYDNQIGAADADDPTTAIGGGSIVIHR